MATFLANWHFHLDALTQVLNFNYQDFEDYITSKAEELDLSQREFMLKLVIGLHDGYAKKVGFTKK